MRSTKHGLDAVLRARRPRLAAVFGHALWAVSSLLLAVVASGVLLFALGRSPLAFYTDLVAAGIGQSFGLVDSVIRMGPLLLIAAGLAVAFRAGLWNLGADGQFLLAAAIVAGVAPSVQRAIPGLASIAILFLVGVAVGGAWSVLPAFLKSSYGMNEVITSLMMNFIGLGVANLLVKGPFVGPLLVQTNDIPELLPGILESRVHVGVIVAIAAVLVLHLLMSRTAFGVGLDVLGSNPRAAVHLGVDVAKLTMIAFVTSGGLVGLAAAIEILGVWGYMRADWNPGYGLLVIPLVFLARLNILAIVPFAALFGVISVGGQFATRRAGLPNDFSLVLVGLMLLAMLSTQVVAKKVSTASRPRFALPKRSFAATGETDA